MSASLFHTAALGLLAVAFCGGCGAEAENTHEMSSPEPSGNASESLNGCAPGAFEDHADDDDERVVLIGADGRVFTPRCLAIGSGQTVRFEGSLAAHPLAPGNPDDASAGSPDNPIAPTSSGTEVEFMFDAPGTFAYYCELHAFGSGAGMAGAILVK